MLWILFASTALAAYLAGSFPTGYLAGRAKGVDLRKEGSGNIGATNALRVLGKKIGYLVFAGDALKGAVGVFLGFLIAARIDPSRHVQAGVVAAIFTVIGHSYPVWLKFQGGKGISTSAGVMLALFPIWVFLSGLTAWLVLFFTTRYVSIASIAASLALPISSGVLMMYGRCDPLLVMIASAMCLLALYRHKSNIQRLLAGTEKKFEKKPRTHS